MNDNHGIGFKECYLFDLYIIYIGIYLTLYIPVYSYIYYIIYLIYV